MWLKHGDKQGQENQDRVSSLLVEDGMADGGGDDFSGGCGQLPNSLTGFEMTGSKLKGQPLRGSGNRPGFAGKRHRRGAL